MAPGDYMICAEPWPQGWVIWELAHMHVIEACLNHMPPGIRAAVYQRQEYLTERRLAFDSVGSGAGVQYSGLAAHLSMSVRRHRTA